MHPAGTRGGGVAGLPGVRAALLPMAERDPSEPMQLRALWALHNAGLLKEADLVGLLGSKSEYVRAWAIQLLAEDPGAPGRSGGLSKFGEMAKSDPSAAVRLYLASALGRLPEDQRWTIAEGLLSHGEDAADHNLPLVIWYGVEPLVEGAPERAMELAAGSAIPKVAQFIARRAASDPRGLGAAVAALPAAGDGAPALIAEILNALKQRPDLPMPESWEKAFAALKESPNEAVRAGMEELAIRFGDRSTFPQMRKVVADAGSDAAKRRRFLKILADAKDGASVPVFQALLADETLRGDALRALANFSDAKSPAAILSNYAAFTEAQKRDAVAALSARPDYAKALLGALADGTVARAEVSAFNARQIKGFGDQEIDAALEKHWGKIADGASETAKVEIARFKKMLSAESLASANLPNGRAVYGRTCFACHTLFGEGAKIGPDITGSNRANLDYILENIIDPNAVIGRDYQLNVVTLKDGRVLSGMIPLENEVTLTVRQITGEDAVVEKKDIAKREVAPVSMMPPGQLQTLSEADARDLIAYLASPSQVPLPGEGPFLDPKTRKVGGAQEGESLKVAKATGGAASPQVMGNFPKGMWSGNTQLWWTGAKPGDSLALTFAAPADGEYEVFAAFTKARDYATADLTTSTANPVPLRFDFFADPDVLTTGPVSLGKHALKAGGSNTLEIKITGANPDAVKAYMVGIDYVWLGKKLGDE
ncbi:MAG: c-type cytochrome [Verrucomicrobiales bacterium]